MAEGSALMKLVGASGVAAAILATRVAFYWGTHRALLAHAPPAGGNKHRIIWVKKVQEEVFTTVGGLVLLLLGSYVITQRNGPSCDLRDTRDCFSGFPTHQRPMDDVTSKYYNLELAWYLHQLPKHLLGVGVSDSGLMWAHHISTIVLVSLAMTQGLHRSAAVILALLNISNPFLHIAKICNIFEFKRMKVIMFALFAIIFFVTRVVAYPFVILKSTCYDSIQVQPRLWFGDLAWVYLTINGLLVAIYIMQIVWMKGILRILLQAVSPKGTAEELRRVAANMDTINSAPHHEDELKKAT